MTRFWKIPFWVIFDHFWSFSLKSDFSVKIPQTIPQGALLLCQISQKTNVLIPTKLTLLKRQKGETEGWRKDGQKDRQKDRLKDRQTLTNPDKPSSHHCGSNKTFAYICQGINHLHQSIIFYYDFECIIKQVQLSGQNLKVKDTEKDVGLKLMHYCQHAKNCSIHKLIFTIKQILQFCELKCHAHFWPHPPKDHWSNI